MTSEKTEEKRTKSENKKLSLVLTIKVLELVGSLNQSVKQVDIARMIDVLGRELDLDIRCDRKTVGRHIKILTAAGYDIVYKKGSGYSYNGGLFTEDEAKLLSALVEASWLSVDVKRALVDKIEKRSTPVSFWALKQYLTE